MAAYKDESYELVRELRAKIRRNEFYIEKRTEGSDRRVAFFSWFADERRVGERRHNYYA